MKILGINLDKDELTRLKYAFEHSNYKNGFKIIKEFDINNFSTLNYKDSRNTEHILFHTYNILTKKFNKNKFEIIDNLIKDIQQKVFSNDKQDSENYFNLDNFEIQFIQNIDNNKILKDTSLEKIHKILFKNYDTNSKDKISIKTYEDYMNIYFIKKLNILTKALNIPIINKSDLKSIISPVIEIKDPVRLFNSTESRKRFSSEISRIFDNTDKKLKKNISKKEFELLGVFDSQFMSLVSYQPERGSNNFSKCIFEADAYRIIEEEKTFYLVDIITMYETRLKLIKLYNGINNLLTVFNRFKNKDEIPLSLCDENIIYLYNFNNLFPKSKMNQLLVIIFTIYLKNPKYEKVRILLSKLYNDVNNKRNKPSEFAPIKQNGEYGELKIKLQSIVDFLDNSYKK